MASTYPYTSGSGPLVQVIVHLRRSFPASVTAETLKKLGIASNNESYIINILRFVNAIDEKGAKTQAATKVFSKHDDAEFQTGFADLIKVAYGDLFVLHGDDAWTLETNKLISFFRNTDQTSDVVGKRQASTFQTLAAQAGQTIPQSPRRNGTSPPKPIPVKKPTTSRTADTTKVEAPVVDSPPSKKLREVGLTVRVEINLPADGDQETYDRIFRSIRENLINGD